MKEKFYLIIEEIVEECSNYSPKPKLFKNEEKAYEYYNERKKDVLSEIEKKDWEVEESCDQIETYEGGYFTQNRHCVYISEIECED